MKYKNIMPAVIFLPLAAVIFLALVGVTLNFWVYLLLAVVCPVAAAISWFFYKDMEKKVSNAKKE